MRSTLTSPPSSAANAAAPPKFSPARKPTLDREHVTGPTLASPNGGAFFVLNPFSIPMEKGPGDEARPAETLNAGGTPTLRHNRLSRSSLVSSEFAQPNLGPRMKLQLPERRRDAYATPLQIRTRTTPFRSSLVPSEFEWPNLGSQKNLQLPERRRDAYATTHRTQTKRPR
jgi:hypothetical protein